MRFRLVASDLDGTLLRTDDTLSPRTRAAIHAVAEKNFFVYATGRPPRWVHPVAELSGHRGLAVCSNGAIIIDLTDESVVDQRLIPTADCLQIIEIVRELMPEAGFATDRPSGFAHDPAYVPVFAQAADTPVGRIEDLVQDAPYKLLFRHNSMNGKVFGAVIEAIGSLGTVTYGSTANMPGSNTLIEVMAAGVSKASALTRICDHYRFRADDVVAFGDMPNDIEMLDWAGHGVAMANAHPDAKAVANEIALSNNEDGVARVLERELAAIVR